MFSDFKKAFKKDEYSTEIPKAIIETLSENLPSGFEYVQVDRGCCGIVYVDGPMSINVSIPFPSDFKPKSPEELMEYMYRTQRELEVPSDYININGHKFKPDEFTKFPLEDIELDNNNWKMVIKPKAFPPPFNLELEGGGVKKIISVQRQPYADMHKSLFKTVDNNLLEISYLVDEEKSGLQLTLNININNAKSVDEIVEASKIYHAFLDGKVKFSGTVLAKLAERPEDTAFIKILEFWEQVFLISEKVGVAFLPQSSISIEDVIWVEKLYKSFIEQKPYKEYIKLNKFKTYTTNEIDEKEILNLENMAFQFAMSENIQLLGVELLLHGIVSLFDFKVIDLVLTNKENLEYEFLLEPTNDKGISQVVRYFIDKQTAEDYRVTSTLRPSDIKDADLININS